MTNIDEFAIKECEKIDPLCVNAAFSFELKDDNNKILILHTSWGDIQIDLSPLVKAAETVTHMKLSPDSLPEYLDYQNETGTHECISGEQLARIIPLVKLKDIEQSTWQDGYAPVWDSDDNIFKPYNVQGSAGGLETRVTALEGQMSAAEVALRTIAEQIDDMNTLLNSVKTRVDTAESAITALDGRVTTVEGTLTKPAGTPTDATVTWGNANLYTQTDKSTGAYVHDPATSVTGDRTINSDVS